MQSANRIGLAPVNRAGVATGADGEEYLCWQGREKVLTLLGSSPGVQFWQEWSCLAFPVRRTNLLLLETVGQIEEATEEYTFLRSRILRPMNRYRGGYPEPSEGEPDPYPHQVEAFCQAREWFGSGGEGFAQLSQMGLGKTRWSIDLMRFYVFQKALVVCQNSTILQWQGQLERCWPECRTVALTEVSIPRRIASVENEIWGFKAWDGQPVVFLLNWEALARMLPVLKKLRPEMVVLDESTRIKDRTTQMAKAAHRLADHCGYRVAMTGTPIGNSPADLWSIYRFVEPGLFGKSYWKFANKYFRLGGFTGREFVGFDPMNLHDFIERMYRCAYRITKATVGSLPEKQREVIRFDMDGEQEKLYRQMEADLFAQKLSDDGTLERLSAASALDQATRLQQITAGLFPSDEGGTRCLESPKTRWLCDYVREKLTASDAHMIVWTRYIEERKRVCQDLVDSGVSTDALGYIDGSVPNKEREQLRLEFNDRSHPRRVLVCQIQAGAFGLDIPQADEMIYHSGTFSLLERSQSEDRGHRLGRERPYTIIDLVLRKTIDEKVLEAIKKKQSLASMLLHEGVADFEPVS